MGSSPSRSTTRRIAVVLPQPGSPVRKILAAAGWDRVMERGLPTRWQGRQESNLQPPVLETGALPVELLPFGESAGSLDRGPPGDKGAARIAPHMNSGWSRWVPGLAVLRGYEPAWLPRDLAAGLVLTTMLVPVGIAYAVASGVPGIHGLYATIVPLLAYALFGPSRIMVLGPDSSLAAVILAIVLPLSAGDPTRAVAIAAAM